MKTRHLALLLSSLATATCFHRPPGPLPAHARIRERHGLTGPLAAGEASEENHARETQRRNSGSTRHEAAGLQLLGAAASALILPMQATAASTRDASVFQPRAASRRDLSSLITKKAYIDVRIIGFRQGGEETDHVGRMVFGLFGKVAPYAVQQFLEYAGGQYGGTTPSYAYSLFTKCIPGILVEGGRIKDVKAVNIAGSTEFAYDGTILPDFGVDDTNELTHDRRGLLTKANLQVGTDPLFDVTLARAPELDSSYTIFGVLLEGEDTLSAIESVPLYTSETTTDNELLNDVVVGTKEQFFNLAKRVFRDKRAIDRKGAFLKRVEVVGSGVV